MKTVKIYHRKRFWFRWCFNYDWYTIFSISVSEGVTKAEVSIASKILNSVIVLECFLFFTIKFINAFAVNHCWEFSMLWNQRILKKSRVSRSPKSLRNTVLKHHGIHHLYWRRKAMSKQNFRCETVKFSFLMPVWNRWDHKFSI